MERYIFLQLMIIRRIARLHSHPRRFYPNISAPSGVSPSFRLLETLLAYVPLEIQTPIQWLLSVETEAITSLDLIHKARVQEKYTPISSKLARPKNNSCASIRRCAQSALYQLASFYLPLLTVWLHTETLHRRHVKRDELSSMYNVHHAIIMYKPIKSPYFNIIICYIYIYLWLQ